MTRRPPIAVLAVAAVGGAAVHLAALSRSWTALEVATKPVPAIALALAVFSSGGGTYRRLVGAGLLASAVGDLLLEFPALFVHGLFAFLVAHVLYAAAFVSDEPRLRLPLAVPFAVYLAVVAAWLWPGLGDMKGPVVAYMFAIGTMMWRAAARVERSNPPPGAWWALVGAVLFALSDTLIAVARFHAPIPGTELSIMSLYWAGQTGIAASAVTRSAAARDDGAVRGDDADGSAPRADLGLGAAVEPPADGQRDL